MSIEERLTAVLVEFARTLVTDFPIRAILDHLVVSIVDVLPISAAGVTLISPGSAPRYVAASDSSALRFEQLQTDLGEGPCIEATKSGLPVVVPDLRVDARFPRFGPRALEAGLAAVFTFPLRQGDEQFGALDLYRTTPGALDDRATAAAQTLADVAASYMLNSQARLRLRDAAERAAQISLHDQLTGLANRSLLLELLESAAQRSSRTKKAVGVLYIDIDGFKAINDAHGHRAGDAVLVEFAARICGVLRPSDTLARVGGDEFVALCEDLQDRSEVEQVSSRIGAALIAPFEVAGVEVRMSASIGIAIRDHAGLDIADLIDTADAAMYVAKRNRPKLPFDLDSPAGVDRIEGP